MFARLFGGSRVCVYVALGNKDLFRVTGMLQDAEIPYQTKIHGISAGINGGMTQPVAGSDFSEYEILVKREDAEQARFVLGV